MTCANEIKMMIMMDVNQHLNKIPIKMSIDDEVETLFFRIICLKISNECSNAHQRLTQNCWEKKHVSLTRLFRSVSYQIRIHAVTWNNLKIYSTTFALHSFSTNASTKSSAFYVWNFSVSNERVYSIPHWSNTADIRFQINKIILIQKNAKHNGWLSISMQI